MKILFCIILISGCITTIKSKDFFMDSFISNTDSSNNDISYSMSDSVINKLPFKNLNNLNRFFPGVVSYFQDFYIRGGESFETGFFIDGTKFNDLFTGKNSFFLNPNVLEKIDFYNGFIPSEFGNVSSGLYNYKLRTGGDKISFEAEHYNDNITFTSDAFSGKKRLGAYFYGHNETNINLGGPLFFDNIKFFISANYLFQRDKNPQRYPGIDATYDNGMLGGDSLDIKMPAGIVPLNSLENFTVLSKFDFDFDDMLISAYGIYFDENTFVERNHILEYLNPRAGLIDEKGGLINLNLAHKMSELLSYSLNANYFSKSEITTDPYLGDNYWAYGDSVANAEAGVVWQRHSYYGRYRVPQDKLIMLWTFRNFNYPGINHQKSEQEKISLNGNLDFNFRNHKIRIGGEFSKNKIRLWQMFGQYNLAQRFADWRENTQFQNYTDQGLKEFIAINWAVNNIGYNPLGDISNTGLYKAPEPFFYSIYLDDQFYIFDNLSFYLGLKYDHFDFDHKKMIDPASPEKTFNIYTLEVNEKGLIDSKNYSVFSPKIYFKFSPLNYLSFIANYSQNVQAIPFSDIFRGVHSALFSLVPGGFVPGFAFQAMDLKPLITRQYEFNITFEPFSSFNTSLAYFNKKTINYPSLKFQETNPDSPIPSYLVYENNGYLNANGIEFLINFIFRGLLIRSNINFQEVTEIYYFVPPRHPFANTGEMVNSKKIDSERSNSLFFNFLFNYDFSHLSYITPILDDLNISAFYDYKSGHPFISTYREGYYAFQRIPETTPYTSQIDLKIEKKVILLNKINTAFYLYVINLFDTKNIFNVFSTTGTVDNDGYDIDNLLQVYGEQLTELHKLMNFYNPDGGQQTFYGPPRQIGFGIKLNY